MTRRFGASSPGCFSQPTTPLEADREGPLAGHSSHQSQWGCEPSRAGAGLCTQAGLPLGCPEPPSASMVALLCPGKAGSKFPTFRKTSAYLPYLWPSQRHC